MDDERDEEGNRRMDDGWFACSVDAGVRVDESLPCLEQGDGVFRQQSPIPAVAGSSACSVSSDVVVPVLTSSSSVPYEQSSLQQQLSNNKR